MALGVSFNTTTGVLDWTPGYSDAGTHNFTINGSDGSLSDNEAFTITVTNTNRAPLLDSISNETVSENSAIAQINAADGGDDQDVDTDTITYTCAVDSAASCVALGVSFNTTTGALDWTPGFSDAGTHNFTITGSDGSLSDDETFTITVNNTNRAPVLDAIGNETVLENVAITAINAADGGDDLDIDSDDIDYTCAVDSAVSCVALGVTFDTDNGDLTWTPGFSDAGTHNFTITGSDGSLSDDETFTITVTNVNRAPVLDAISDETVAENSAISAVNAADGGDDLDIDGDDIDYTCAVDSAPSCVALGVTFDTDSGDLTWTPGFSDAGTHNFTITGSDGSLSDDETFTITVTNTNRAPVLDAISDETVSENSAITQINAADGGDDNDIDNDVITYTCQVNASSCATVTGISFIGSTGVLDWTPSFDQAGTYNFVITGSDGSLDDTEGFTITVNNTNRAPVLDAIGNETVLENVAITAINAADGGDDLDIDSEDIDYTCAVDSAASCVALGVTFDTDSGDLTWTPGFSDAGTHNFTITGSDGSLSDDETFTITVTNVNRAPVLDSISNETVAENSAITAVNAADGGDDLDIDGDDIDYTCAVDSAASCVALGVTFDTDNGDLTWTPGFSDAGTHNFTITGSDGSLSDDETFTITVTNTNRAPVLDAIGNETVLENVAITAINAGDGGDDLDIDNDDIDYTCAVDSAASCVALGVTFDTDNGDLTWTPSFTDAGTHNFTITGSDGSLSDDETFTITVTNVNRTPVLDAISNETVAEASAITQVNAADGGDDQDVDLDTITYSCAVDSAASCAALGVSFNTTTGVLDWTPGYSDAGTHNFTITGSDGSLSDDETFTITVTNTNRAPSLAAQSDATGDVNVSISDIDNNDGGDDLDIDGDTITYSCSWDAVDNDSEDATNSCSLNGFSFNTSTGVLSGAPDTEGAYEFQVTGSDGSLEDSVFFTITAQSYASHFIEIATGGYHSCGLVNDGRVYCWGGDSEGQLGDGGTNTDQIEAVLVDTTNLSSGEAFISIDLGDLHSCGITDLGNLFCWGDDTYGQLGDAGSNSDQILPVAVDRTNLASGEGFVSLSLSGETTCAITSLGNTYCWGRDQYGQLGDGGSNTDRNLPVAIDETNLSSGEKFVQVSAGLYHTCGLTGLGNTYCWGRDNAGQLGNGGTNTDSGIPVITDITNLGTGQRFIEISSGYNHTCGIASNGDSFCWGFGTYGRLGTGNNSNQNRPIAISTTNFATNERAIKISTKFTTTCVVTGHGNTFCWGIDNFAQLGNGGANSDSATPVVIDTSNIASGDKLVSVKPSNRHSCGLTGSGRTYCWGSDGSGQLGNGVASSEQNVPIVISVSSISAVEKFKTIAAGNNHTCGVSSDGSPYCWGANSYGKLGDGTGSSRYVPTSVDESYLTVGEKFLEILPGYFFTCGLTSHGNAFCWGRDFYGQLGNGGSNLDSSVPVMVSPANLSSGEKFKKLSVGFYSACGVTSLGNIYCWGREQSGQLGDGGSDTNQIRPVLVDSSNLATGDKFVSVSMGNTHACAISGLGQTYCWGDDGYGSLGDNTSYIDQSVPVVINYTNLQSNERFTKINASDYFTCGQTDHGNSYCWGYDYDGQIGDGAPLSPESLPQLVSTTNLNSGDRFLNLASSGYHTCWSTVGGDALCTGRDSYGQLGYSNSSVDQGEPVKVNQASLLPGESLKDIAAGYSHSCALSGTGNAYCWGRDVSGALGNGLPTSDSDIPVPVYFGSQNGEDVAPTLIFVNNETVEEGQAITPLDFNDINTENDTDMDGDAITYTCAVDSAASCADLGVSFDTGTGLLTWTTAGGDAGTHNFTIIGSEGNLMDNSTFTITVNLPNQVPVLDSVADQNLENGSSISSIDIGDDGDDLDVDGDTITYTCSWDDIPDNTSNASNSCNSLGFTFNSTTGVLSGTPTTDGIYEFQVDGSDGSLSDTIYFVVEVWTASKEWIKISANEGGDHHACGISNTGDTYCWGWDNENQIGDSSTYANADRPKLVDTSNLPAGEKFHKISSGGRQNCGITGSGDAYCWGRDLDGELGYSLSTADQGIPVPVNQSPLASGEKFIDIYCGDYTTCGITNNQNTFCWGSGTDDSIGDGGGVNRDIPTSVSMTNVPSGERFVHLSMGFRHVCGLTGSGGVYCWGNGTGASIPTAVNLSPLSTGEYFVELDMSHGLGDGAGLTNFGRIFDFNGLNISLIMNTVAPAGERFVVFSSDFVKYGVTNKGGLYGESNSYIVTGMQANESFIQLNVGSSFQYGLSNNGVIYSWGGDSYGQLGNGSGSGSTLDLTEVTAGRAPFRVVEHGTAHSCGIRTNGKLYCWGDNTDGQVGIGITGGNIRYPVEIDTSGFFTNGESFIEVAAGGSHTCASSNRGNTYCWGANIDGQVGDNFSAGVVNTPSAVIMTNVTSPQTFVELDLGAYHSCGITSSGVTFCWGRDDNGEVGNGATTGDQGIPVAVSMTNVPTGETFVELSLGDNYSCGITPRGHAYCWGDDTNVSIGNSAVGSDQDEPVLVATTNLATGESFVQLSAHTHTCGVTSQGRTFCWGTDSNEALGNGATNSQQEIPVLIDSTNLPTGQSFVSVAVGSISTCGITGGNEVYCWGTDTNGGIGNGSSSSAVQTIPVSVDNSNLASSESLISLSSGGLHACGSTNFGNLFCWGSSQYGELAIGYSGLNISFPTNAGSPGSVGSIISISGSFGMSNGNHLASCNEYINSDFYSAQGDGTYWIDLDGSGGDPAFEAYCDMTTDGGGWTRIVNGSTTTLSDLANFGDTSAISATFTTDATYGISWGPVNGATGSWNWPVYQTQICYQEIKTTYSAHSDVGMAAIRIENPGEINIVYGGDAWWNSSNEYRVSVHEGGVQIQNQGSTEYWNRSYDYDSGTEYCTIDVQIGAHDSYPGFNQWLNYLWVR